MARSFYGSLLTALLTLMIFSASPNVARADHSWGGYHWARASAPFTLKLGDNLSTAWDSYLVTASAMWSNSAAFDTGIVGGGTLANVRKCRPTSGRVEVCNTTYGNNGWLGIAQIWISGFHITQGTVRLNDTYFNTAKYNTAGWRNLVMCQEIGHTFGLDHQDETFGNPNLGTCMDYTNDPDGTLANPDQVSNEFPNPHDYEEITSVYSHLDSTTTVKQSLNNKPPALNDEPDRLGTGQWGRLIRSSNRGRTELYELNLGRGHKILTHIIWADPEE